MSSLSIAAISNAAVDEYDFILFLNFFFYCVWSIAVNPTIAAIDQLLAATFRCRRK